MKLNKINELLQNQSKEGQEFLKETKAESVAKMLLRVLKHFKSDIQGIGMFSFGIAIGHKLDNDYAIIALWIAVITLTINAVVGFIELGKR